MDGWRYFDRHLKHWRSKYIWRKKTFKLAVDICSLRCLWNIQVRCPVGRCRAHEKGQVQRHKFGNHQHIGGSWNSGSKWHYQGWPSRKLIRDRDSENSGVTHYFRGKEGKQGNMMSNRYQTYRRKAQKTCDYWSQLRRVYHETRMQGKW